MTKVNMVKLDIRGYTGSTVRLGQTWVDRIDRGIPLDYS